MIFIFLYENRKIKEIFNYGIYTCHHQFIHIKFIYKESSVSGSQTQSSTVHDANNFKWKSTIFIQNRDLWRWHFKSFLFYFICNFGLFVISYVQFMLSTSHSLKYFFFFFWSKKNTHILLTLFIYYCILQYIFKIYKQNIKHINWVVQYVQRGITLLWYRKKKN